MKHSLYGYFLEIKIHCSMAFEVTSLTLCQLSQLWSHFFKKLLFLTRWKVIWVGHKLSTTQRDVFSSALPVISAHSFSNHGSLSTQEFSISVNFCQPVWMASFCWHLLWTRCLCILVILAYNLWQTVISPNFSNIMLFGIILTSWTAWDSNCLRHQFGAKLYKCFETFI